MGAMQKLKNLFVGEDELEQEDAMYQQPMYENKTEYNEAPKNTGAYGNNARPVRMEQTTTLQIVLARPNDFSEVKSIGGDINGERQFFSTWKLSRARTQREYLTLSQALRMQMVQTSR